MSLEDLWNKKRLTLDHLSSEFTSVEIQAASAKFGNNARQILWHRLNNVTDIPLCCCGKPLSWNSDTRNYRQFCSKKCTAIYSQDKIKETNLRKYGVSHFSKTPEFIEKMRETSIKKYGVEFYTQTNEYKESAAKTNQSKYGTTYPAQSELIKKKTSDRFVEKYGVENPMHVEVFKERQQETNKQRYGVKSPLGNIEVRNKGQETLKERYGSSNVMKISSILKQRVETRRKNYYNKDTLAKLDNISWLTSENQKGKGIDQIAQELGVSASNLYKHFHANHIEIKKNFRSAMENEFAQIFGDFDIIAQDRKQIYPYEIDLYFADKKIGIEINGAYYHSESQGKDKNYHLKKTDLATKKGIMLYQFFDWEIQAKKDIIIDLIRHRLGLNRRIGARTLEIIPLNNKQTHEFYEKNHMQGACHSSINYGLIDDDKTLLAAMSFGKSRFNKKYQWELIRFCSSKGISVIGGASKLLKHFVKNHCSVNDKIVSYCNRRWSDGNLYYKLGFSLENRSLPGYYYVTKSGKYVGTRQQWQKHKLKKRLEGYRKDLSEIENMTNHGFTRVWDCGQLVFILNCANQTEGVKIELL